MKLLEIKQSAFEREKALLKSYHDHMTAEMNPAAIAGIMAGMVSIISTHKPLLADQEVKEWVNYILLKAIKRNEIGYDDLISGSVKTLSKLGANWPDFLAIKKSVEKDDK